MAEQGYTFFYPPKVPVERPPGYLYTGTDLYLQMCRWWYNLSPALTQFWLYGYYWDMELRSAIMEYMIVQLWAVLQIGLMGGFAASPGHAAVDAESVFALWLEAATETVEVPA